MLPLIVHGCGEQRDIWISHSTMVKMQLVTFLDNTKLQSLLQFVRQSCKQKHQWSSLLGRPLTMMTQPQGVHTCVLLVFHYRSNHRSNQAGRMSLWTRLQIQSLRLQRGHRFKTNKVA